MKLIRGIGLYMQMLRRFFSNPGQKRIFRNRMINELYILGVQSLPIILIISAFIGGVSVIQTSFNVDGPLTPKIMVGFVTRQIIILEFAPTMLCLILAGKVGSLIASEIGTMKVTEQVDALELMGINSAAYLMLPKILAAMFFFPVLIVLGAGVSLISGYFVVAFSQIIPLQDYVEGLMLDFRPFTLTYMMVKTIVFAFLITTISGFFGYNTRGGALEVGQASTKAVVNSSIAIIVINLVLTQLMLV
ncbi:MAG: ABC transporter permease [Bacteroidales bacterium]|nr:ABC transporter permease [Bacteroidales bacterium]